MVGQMTPFSFGLLKHWVSGYGCTGLGDNNIKWAELFKTRANYCSIVGCKFSVIRKSEEWSSKSFKDLRMCSHIRTK